MAVQYILRGSWIVYTENQSFLMYSVVTKVCICAPDLDSYVRIYLIFIYLIIYLMHGATINIVNTWWFMLFEILMANSTVCVPLCYLMKLHLRSNRVLGAVAYWPKAPISFATSLSPSVGIYRRDYHRTGFREIWYWGVLRQFVRNRINLVKIG